MLTVKAISNDDFYINSTIYKKGEYLMQITVLRSQIIQEEYNLVVSLRVIDMSVYWNILDFFAKWTVLECDTNDMGGTRYYTIFFHYLRNQKMDNILT